MPLVIANVPDRLPGAVGTNVTLTMQLAPAASVAVHVLPLNPNPFAIPVASTARLRPVKDVTVPGLVIVTGTGCPV